MASPQSDQDAEKQVEQDAGTRKFIPVFVGLCLGVFQVALDEVVLGIAASTITDEFNSLNDLGWYGSAYLLTSCSFQLLFGKVYSILSVKTTYIVALAIFEIGSIVCATAQSSGVFIVGRAIAGLGAGGILSGSLTIISRSLPLSKVAPFNGIVGAVNALAFLCGPLISGAIIAGTTWRWIFYMNPIISAPTFAIVIFMLPLDPPKKTTWRERLRFLDLPSSLVLAAGLICLLLALQWAGTTYAWRNARIIALLVVAGVLLGLFLANQIRMKENGLIPLSVLAKRSMPFGMFFSFCTSGAGFAMEYYLPIWLQAIKAKSVLASGVLLLPVISAAIVFTLTSGFLIALVKYIPPFMYTASVFLAVGLGLLSTLSATSPIRDALGYQVPVGIGLGLALQQTVVAAQTVLAPQNIPIGLSLIVLSQTLGGVVSLSVSKAIFSGVLSSSVAKQIPTADKSLVLDTGATNFRDVVPAEFLDSFLKLYNDAIVKTWYFCLALACVSVLGAAGMEWVRVAPPPTPTASEAAGEDPEDRGSGEAERGGEDAEEEHKSQ